MALQAENISTGKIIGIGPVTILPGESQAIPKEYETNPMLAFYKEAGFIRTTGTVDPGDTVQEASAQEDESDAAEALRKARLASLKTITDEALTKLAEELGVNPADCKDTADMKKKVREALKA